MAGPCRGGPPSTIVDVSDEPRLVRDGAVPWSRVLEFLGSPRVSDRLARHDPPVLRALTTSGSDAYSNV